MSSQVPPPSVVARTATSPLRAVLTLACRAMYSRSEFVGSQAASSITSRLSGASCLISVQVSPPSSERSSVPPVMTGPTGDGAASLTRYSRCAPIPQPAS